MFDTKSKSELVSDLSYALDVMEENSHLGLDEDAACKLREILIRQIEDARAGISSRSPFLARYPVSTKTHAW